MYICLTHCTPSLEAFKNAHYFRCLFLSILQNAQQTTFTSESHIFQFERIAEILQRS